MKKLTLKQCKERPIEDFWAAIIKEDDFGFMCSKSVLVKIDEDTYQNLSPFGSDIYHTGDFLYIKPLGEYYKKKELEFVDANGVLCIDAQDLRPFNRFIRDFEHDTGIISFPIDGGDYSPFDSD